MSNLLPKFLSAANLSLFNQDNEFMLVVIDQALGMDPDLDEFIETDAEHLVKLRLVRAKNAKGASAVISKAYSEHERFPGPTYPLAIKKMHHSKINPNQKSDFYQLLNREVEALQEICFGEDKSYYFPRYFGSFYLPNTDEHWLALEFCDGGDLSFLKKLPINYDHISAIAASTLAGLEVIHELGYIHADIKPDNLLITSPGLVKLTDFGLTAKIKGVEYPDYHALGTTRYMSPELMIRNVYLDHNDERAEDLIYDYRTDIWSVGILLLEMLIGRCPLLNLRKTDKNESAFCEYIKNMTKDRQHNQGSGLFQILFLRDAYRDEVKRVGRNPYEDLIFLRERVPNLKLFKDEELLTIFEQNHLEGIPIDPSAPLPKFIKKGLYRFSMCLDFIAQCLICNVNNRPTATALKAHPFVNRQNKELEAYYPKIKEMKEDYTSYEKRKTFWKKYPAKLTYKQINELILLKEEFVRISIKSKEIKTNIF